MKLLCITESQDRYTKQIYKQGNIYEFEDRRAQQVLKSGYFEGMYEASITEPDQLPVEPAPTEESASITEPDQREKKLTDMSANELKVIAEGLDVKFNSRTTKDELLKAIESAQVAAELDAVFTE